ncbi:tRNA threonylcarbamoyladenosine biosynthesis protein TsaB [uncultured Gammaproteobacteria bacterium]|uniref:tRNA (adenosine(37)-N6)-threonylcarbamoyltransferase complex dimerization subunit type 1 TsaB n=1 Tax=Bathymodiolus heckerae thiotrophic gill symbiont TaxID=1052212 RepID=UPI0010B3DEEB|nr:tRNA (adenosine(37)-N6)-threonylcarbamoyltransferase complex dimerization subunit type 1 TsaB [Bathymodiolus heckerae thiotrophic gill symbiont]CAC9528320.1 tRNA threonylcarbamoyladenosine biosynthesis protein TsaB [uncultured Gammaproteobacteria bacterium]CAC9606097.1 tRNA threonylcarbamoyladenosine biosynthesis protein TsaB [uncultured Gammaproteobacteria bacterium]SHN92053.1 TsaB protein, required for threonylcarbamoyladenosine (t(6)A) formation in tRNA [Bathymodiolus heckerae thiotrophic 
MQNILAIDTCTEVCSVSLYAQSKKTSRFLKDVTKSSGLILPLCDEVLDEMGLDVKDLDLIVYTKGPGAFTGVRMCVSVAQGMSLAFDIPTLGFSTLAVAGYGASQKFKSNNIAIALDARMNEIYWGVYENNRLIDETIFKPESAPKLGSDYVGVGTGWSAYQQDLTKATGIENYQADFYPKAENLIEMALIHIGNNQPMDDNLPLPTYLRNNVAKKSLK